MNSSFKGFEGSDSVEAYNLISRMFIWTNTEVQQLFESCPVNVHSVSQLAPYKAIAILCSPTPQSESSQHFIDWSSIIAYDIIFTNN